jgi:hypothetical protein
MDEQQGGIGWKPNRIKSEVSASHYDDGRSKSHVGFVNPMHFLHATTPDNQHMAQIVDQAGQLDKEKLSKEGQSPFFRVDNGKIVGHEGRHRMSALARQGYTSIPVAIHYGKGEKLDPAESVTLQPQFKGRNPVTVSNLVPLHHDYDDKINNMMEQQPEHFQDGGDVDGITAYHGSPHDFEQFDTSKIGTGEGAQSYGHGLYFAGHEPVAEGYRDRLGAHHETSGETMADQHVIEPHFYKHMSEDEIADNMNNAAQWAEKRIFDQGKMKYLYSDGSMLIHDEDRVRAVQKHPGHMYEVHINAHPDHFLDWDKDLNHESNWHAGDNLPGIRHYDQVMDHFDKSPSGGEFYEKLSNLAGSRQKASQLLANAGIKGIKYLDETVRKPTHNYVVFDHNDVHIKRKYEQGGRVGFDNGGSVHDKYLPHNHPQRQQNFSEFIKESKVKHPDGRPKVVYHNTDRSFSEFRTGETEMGAHFGTPAQANDILEGKYDQENHQGYPAYLNLKKPLRLRDTGNFKPRNVAYQLQEMGLLEGLGRHVSLEEVQNHIKSLGYDGVVYLNRREGISRAKGKDPERYNDYSDQMFKHHFPDAEDSYIAFDPTQIKSAIGNNGYYDQNEPDITKAEGGDVWDDSRVRRSGEGGTETALDFIQNAPLYKQRMEAQAPQPAPAATPSTGGKPMPVTAGPPPTPPAIVQPAQPVQQKQEAPQAQGQVGLYHIGTNDTDSNMTVQSAQRIIESSRAMGINPVFLLPNQTARGLFNNPYVRGDDGLRVANNSTALQKYLDEQGIQYVMPEYNNKVDPYHMTGKWTQEFAKTYSNPFIAGDSNAVRLNMLGYKAKVPDGKRLIDTDSGASLSWGAQTSKTIANELEKYLRWQQQNRTQRNTGGRINFSSGGFFDPTFGSLAGIQAQYTQGLPPVGIPSKPVPDKQGNYLPDDEDQSLLNNGSNAGQNGPTPGEGSAGSGGGGGEGGGGGGGGPGGGTGEWRGGRIDYNTGGPVTVSKGQDTAGNFKKKHEKIHGIPVAIEVKKGQDRVKYDPNGKLKFKAKQYADYGAILGTKDADGMDTDVMVGPHKDSEKVYIIDQRKHSTGKFDEHKVMLGFNKRKKAIKAYTKSYADRHGKDRVQDVVKTDIAGLKKWLKRGDLKKSVAKDALINRALEVVSKKT